MLYAGQESVYSVAAKTLNKFLLCQTDPKQIERLVHAYGTEVGQELEKQADRTLPTAKEGQRTYVMMDGSMISTRDQGWKEVKLGRVFAASDHLPENEQRRWIRDSVYMGLLGSQRDFLKKLEPVVDRLKDPVFINDGAKWIWAWVNQYYPDKTQILDFYHALEYLNKFASEQFKVPEERKKWVQDQAESLLQDEIDQVIEDVEALKSRTQNAKKARKSILTYYQNNRCRMRYKTYLDKGLMIGSGPIEAAHKSVIQDRLKKSGQRWTIDGANAIIQLRTVNQSNKWDLVVNVIKDAA